MFALSKHFRDEQLGELLRRGHYWKGSLPVPPCGTFGLALAGSREAPDLVGLALAKELPQRFTSLMSAIQSALFEHYTPYREAIDEGRETGSPCPLLVNPEAVWPHVSPAHILVEPGGRVATIEIAFRVAWDIEHTVGTRFQEWQFIELNGSVRAQ